MKKKPIPYRQETFIIGRENHIGFASIVFGAYPKNDHTKIEGSLEVKLPTILCAHDTQRWEESETTREKGRRSKKRKSQKKEIAGARKNRKIITLHFFQPCVMICGSGGWKSRLTNGLQPCGQMRDK